MVKVDMEMPGSCRTCTFAIPDNENQDVAYRCMLQKPKSVYAPSLWNTLIGAVDKYGCPLIEVKKGEWFDTGSLSCRCSNCGCKNIKESRYCPWCGADMRGKEE